MQLNGNGSIDCIGTRIGALAFAREEARLGDCAACARLRDCGVASMLQLDVTCCLTEGGHASLRSFPGAGDPVSKGPETKGKSKSPDVRAIPAVVSHSQSAVVCYAVSLKKSSLDSTGVPRAGSALPACETWQRGPRITYDADTHLSLRLPSVSHSASGIFAQILVSSSISTLGSPFAYFNTLFACLRELRFELAFISKRQHVGFGS